MVHVRLERDAHCAMHGFRVNVASISNDFDMKIAGAALAGLVVAGFAFLRWVPLSSGKLWLVGLLGAGAGMTLVLTQRGTHATIRGTTLTQMLVFGALAGGLWAALLLCVGNAWLDGGPPAPTLARVLRFEGGHNPHAVLQLDLGGTVSVYVGRGLARKLDVNDVLQIKVWPGAFGIPYVVRGEVVEAIELKGPNS